MKRLILAGAGHAHLHVLQSLAARPWPGVEVILVSPYARQMYSGMIPGWIAGHYTLSQCAVPLEPLARAAGVRFVRDEVASMNALERIVRTARSGDIPYDVLSLDTGAQGDNSFLAASGAPLVPIRPLENFVLAWDDQLAVFKRRGKASLTVVGGGAGGVELALAVRYRLDAELGAQRVQVHLVTGPSLLPGYGRRIVAGVRRTLELHQVVEIDGYAAGAPDGLQLDNGSTLATDCIIAATGVRPAVWLAGSGLALASDGFIAVADGQQSVSHPKVFAAGDIAARVDAPHARSGVYAVRAGPVLTVNLQRALMGLPPSGYRPQKHSLYLLATGPKDAILSWGNFTAGGYWVWKWKDWIDRRFISQYDLENAIGRGGEN